MATESDNPPLATNRGQTWRVFIEPISGSGERVIAGVIARLDSGDIKTISALNPKALECVYGKKGLVLAKYADDMLQSARWHLEKHANLEGYAPSFSGFELTDPQVGFADTAAELAQSEIMLGASFALHRGRQVSDQDSDQDDSKQAERVRSAVVKRSERLSQFFGKRFEPFESERTVNVYYGGPGLVANFNRFTPQNISYFEGRTKIKIFDLITVQRGTIHDPDEELFEMILMTPTDKAAQKGSTEKQFKAYKSALEQFERLGDAEQIRVRQLHSTKAAADHIISKSAA